MSPLQWYVRENSSLPLPPLYFTWCISVISYRKCHNLIRDLPLKVKSKKHYIPMAGSSPPPPKRLHSDYSAEPRPLQASPLKSKRFSLVPNRGSSKDKPDMHMVQIFWPVSSQFSSHMSV